MSGPIPAARTETLIDLLAATGQPLRYLDGLADHYRRDVGCAMLTLMTYDDVGAIASRVYTTDQVNYPVSGRKSMLHSGWAEQVLGRQEVFVANTYQDFQPHYVDWEKLRDLGYGAAVNFPVVVDGHTIGTVNLMAEPGFYSEARVRGGQQLSSLAAIGFLLLAHHPLTSAPT